MTFNEARNILAIKFYGTEEGKEINKILNQVDDDPWHTGTPTEEGLYVVLTKVSTDGVASSEGTYILDYWDGYSFKYLERRAMISALTEPDKYSWVAWQKIELYKEKEDGRTD